MFLLRIRIHMPLLVTALQPPSILQPRWGIPGSRLSNSIIAPRDRRVMAGRCPKHPPSGTSSLYPSSRASVPPSHRFVFKTLGYHHDYCLRRKTTNNATPNCRSIQCVLHAAVLRPTCPSCPLLDRLVAIPRDLRCNRRR